MKKLNILFLLLTTSLVIGCAHTVQVGLHPKYDENISKDNALTSVQPSFIFKRGEYTDKRADRSKLTSFKQQMHTYNLYAERPFEDAIFEGLKVLAINSGQAWTESDSADVRINLQFLNFQASRNAGFINVDASSSIQIKLDFVDTKTESMIYTQVYNGVDDRSQAIIGLMDMVKGSIDASIINCLNSVGKDGDLVKALNKFKSK